MTFFQRLRRFFPGQTIVTHVRGERVQVIVMMMVIHTSEAKPEAGSLYAAFQFLDRAKPKEGFLRATVERGEVSVTVLTGDEERRIAAQLPMFLLLYRGLVGASEDDDGDGDTQ